MEKYCISVDWLQLCCICNFAVGVGEVIVAMLSNVGNNNRKG